VNALIFDCDGVLADTERDGHLPAFNQTFAEFGLPLRWSEDEYAVKLKIGGGKERLASILTPQFAREASLPADPAKQRELVADWHRRKTEIFTQLVTAGKLGARPGIARLAHDAHERGWELAVASTSAPESVQAVLRSVVGDELARAFTVFAGDVVPRKKPAPDIYLYALEHLHAAAEDALVVEDSGMGLLAATAAGLPCVVTLSSFTKDEPMNGAELVVSSLGDPGGERTAVISNPRGLRIDDYVRITDLAQCFARVPAGEPARSEA
jgi:HAD superfamily hydrolase (TIGR01509 family)